MAPIFLIVNLVIAIITTIASTLIQQSMRHDVEVKKLPAPSGVHGTINGGGDVPLSFIIGRFATAGSLEYVGTWGNSDGTPNAYLTKVISVSDLPVRGLSGVFVNGERVTLADSPTGNFGYAVDEYRDGGEDHLWIKFYDGTQTSADQFLQNKFDSGTRNWTSNMVGRGVAYVICTALINRELFSGFPEYLFEIDGIDMTDPRGDDEQNNNIVAIREIMLGLEYDGDWFYGPQGIGSTRLPSTNWEAEMDKCDVKISKSGGGKENRFRCGMEVYTDTEPHIVIGELLKGCSGRIAEIGGKYRVLVGEPGSSVFSFDDEDIIITSGQTYDPFPGLESVFNAVTATYPEPDESWQMKEAPPRYSSSLEAEDIGRRLPFNTEYSAVPYPYQVQRLMRAAIEEARRFRRHSITGGPEWWEYEPLDAVDWSSTRNGYDEKLFLISVVDDLPNGNQVVGLQEQDPDDYSWNSSLELEFDVSDLTVNRPSPQLMTGWQAVPAIFTDNDGNSRRPSIEVSYDGGLQDVRSIRVQVRLAGETGLAFDGRHPYDTDDASPSKILNGTFLPDTDYEVRGKFIPYTGRVTRWSNQDVNGVNGAWLAVTTPDVKLSFRDFNQAIEDSRRAVQEILRDILEEIEAIVSATADQDYGNYSDWQKLSTVIESRTGDALATAQQELIAATGPDSALAASITSLRAALGGNASFVNVFFRAEAGPAGYSARYAVTLGVEGDVDDRSAAFFIDVPADSNDPSRIALVADQTVIVDSGGNVLALFDGTEFNAVLIPDLIAEKITAGTMSSVDGNSFWNLDTGAFRIST